jgi:hypothetical protein
MDVYRSAWCSEAVGHSNNTFDSYFTNADILNHIDNKGRNYVDDLMSIRTISFDGSSGKQSSGSKPI